MKQIFYSIYIDAVVDVNEKSTGIGIFIRDKKRNIIKKISNYDEGANVNRARSKALKTALKEMRNRDVRRFEICSDSELFVRQLQGIYQIRDPILKQLKNAIHKKFRDIRITIRQVSLNENREANSLAKKGLEKFRRERSLASSLMMHGKAKVKEPGGARPAEDIQCSAGGVVYKKEGDKYKICIIAKRNFRVWALPKGRVAEGETPKETAVREVMEETGHLSEIKGKIDQIDYYFYWKDNDTMYHKFVYFYLMPLIKENVQKRDQEADAVRWVMVGEAHKMLTYINEKEVMRKARKILDQMS